MGELKAYKGGYYLWRYLPSRPAAIIFCLLFVSATLAHAYRLYRLRLWFCLPLAIGGLSM